MFTHQNKYQTQLIIHVYELVVRIAIIRRLTYTHIMHFCYKDYSFCGLRKGNEIHRITDVIGMAIGLSMKIISNRLVKNVRALFQSNYDRFIVVVLTIIFIIFHPLQIYVAKLPTFFFY